MGKLHHYISLIVFATALMVGVQFPNFIDQYVKRVDAHFQEAQVNIDGFLVVAKQFHNGSIERMIDSHKQSTDPAFRAEAQPIQAMYERKVELQAEREALQAPLWQQARHILLSRNTELLDETWQNYSSSLPLNTDAIVCGLAFGVVASIALEFLLSLLAAITGVSRGGTSHRHTAS
jgi:hypothetical protein